MTHNSSPIFSPRSCIPCFLVDFPPISVHPCPFAVFPFRTKSFRGPAVGPFPSRWHPHATRLRHWSGRSPTLPFKIQSFPHAAIRRNDALHVSPCPFVLTKKHPSPQNGFSFPEVFFLFSPSDSIRVFSSCLPPPRRRATFLSLVLSVGRFSIFPLFPESYPSPSPSLYRIRVHSWFPIETTPNINVA